MEGTEGSKLKYFHQLVSMSTTKYGFQNIFESHQLVNFEIVEKLNDSMDIESMFFHDAYAVVGVLINS